jgi:hypothetical protein
MERNRLKEIYNSYSIRTIQINCKIFSITVIGSKDDNIRVSWENTQYRSLNIVPASDILRITDSAELTFYGMRALIELKRNKEVLIEIPIHYKGSLVIESAEEGINMDGVYTDGDIFVRSTAGFVRLYNIQGKHIDLVTGPGGIDAERLNVQNGIHLTSVNGNIYCSINDRIENYKMNCFTLHGRCNLPNYYGEGAKTVQARSTTGSVNITFQEEIEHESIYH